jgi:transcriptional regulator with XRE-family HTH domain
MPLLSELSSAVRERRAEMGLSQHALAELAGLSRTTISDLEQGKLGNLALSRAEKLLNVLGMSIEVSPGHKSSGRTTRHSAVDDAARTASVSYRKALPPEVLRQSLLTGETPAGYSAQIRALLDEAPVSVLSSVAHQLEREAHLPARIVWQNMRTLAARLQCARDIWG